MELVFTVENGRFVSYKVEKYSDGRFATTLFSDTLGYAKPVAGTTINDVLVNEIKTIKEKIKTHPKEKSLRWILAEVKKKRIEYSQLSMF